MTGRENTEQPSVPLLVIRELTPEEIAECARKGRALRQEIQKEIDRINHLNPRILDFVCD